MIRPRGTAEDDRRHELGLDSTKVLADSPRRTTQFVRNLLVRDLPWFLVVSFLDRDGQYLSLAIRQVDQWLAIGGIVPTESFDIQVGEGPRFGDQRPKFALAADL